MDILFVGIGGAFGAVTRFGLGKLISQKSHSVFPVGTFIINISGAILLGVLTSINSTNNIYLLLGDGFLGAYTTFSTFMYEGFNLFQGNEKKNALTYILASLILGVIGFLIGFEIIKIIKVT